MVKEQILAIFSLQPLNVCAQRFWISELCGVIFIRYSECFCRHVIGSYFFQRDGIYAEIDNLIPTETTLLSRSICHNGSVDINYVV